MWSGQCTNGGESAINTPNLNDLVHVKQISGFGQIINELPLLNGALDTE